MIKEGKVDKVSLSHQRAELVTSLVGTLSAEDRVRIQGALSLINAVLEVLVTGLYAAAQGQELPDLPSSAPRSKSTGKPKKQ